MNPMLFPTTRRLCSDVPLVERGALMALLQTYRAAEPPEFEELREWLSADAYEAGEGSGVWVLPVNGVLARKPHPMEMLMGMEDTDAIEDKLTMLAEDPSVRAIVLDIDSPGGFVTGVPELADAVRRAAADKPVHAHTSGDMCSAAYWIGSQAGSMSASRSATVGSIGVYSAFVDYTRMLEAAGIKVEVFANEQGTFKAAGYPGTALTDEQRHEIQMGVEDTFAEFKEAVTSVRSLDEDTMRGQTFTGRQAAKNGLVDHEVSLEGAIAHLKRNVSTMVGT